MRCIISFSNSIATHKGADKAAAVWENRVTTQHAPERVKKSAHPDFENKKQPRRKRDQNKGIFACANMPLTLP